MKQQRVDLQVAADEVADALERIAPRVRAGVIVGVSIEWADPATSARITYMVAPGALVLDPELAGAGVDQDLDD